MSESKRLTMPELRMLRPIANLNDIEHAINNARLEVVEMDIIEYIRFVGSFTQPGLTQALRLRARPPALSILCEACRKIGNYIPDHFDKVREWSAVVSVDGVRWDGDLLCSAAFNIDGLRLSPEEATSQFHTFAVHPELFNGLD